MTSVPEITRLLAHIAELLSFPAGRHDDQVDALGLAGQLLDIMTPGQKPGPAQPVRRLAVVGTLLLTSPLHICS